MQGYQSAICCEAPSTGCCGRNGYAIGGCKCAKAEESCCGNLYNTICDSESCCCGKDDYASCCAKGKDPFVLLKMSDNYLKGNHVATH